MTDDLYRWGTMFHVVARPRLGREGRRTKCGRPIPPEAQKEPRNEVSPGVICVACLRVEESG